MVITDIYKGEMIEVWHDGELATIVVYPNGLMFSVPLEHLAGFFSELSEAQASYRIQEVGER